MDYNKTLVYLKSSPHHVCIVQAYVYDVWYSTLAVIMLHINTETNPNPSPNPNLTIICVIMDLKTYDVLHFFRLAHKTFYIQGRCLQRSKCFIVTSVGGTTRISNLRWKFSKTQKKIVRRVVPNTSYGYYDPAQGALSDDARLTSVSDVCLSVAYTSGLIENKEA